MAEKKEPVIRQELNDLFDAYTIISGSSYVSLYDTKGMMTRYSPASVELIGLPGEYIPDGADDWSDYVHPEDRKRYQDVMGELLASGAKFYNLTYRVRIKDGSYVLFRFIGSVIYDGDGAPEMVGGIMINESLLENTDPLTVLRNRYGFFNDLHAMIELKQTGNILMMSIAGMEEINIEQGFSYGNKILRQVALFLEQNLSQDGTLYRLDGVKFGFITDQLSQDEIAAKYEHIRQELLSGIHVDEIRQSLKLSGAMISIDAMSNENALYTCLEYAYHESKQRRNGRIVSFDGGGEKQAKGSVEMIAEIRDSILTDFKGFSLQYQPIIKKDSEEVIAVESLVRYHSDRFGDVPPRDFVPVLENNFVFEELGNWILRRAMTDGMRFLEKNPDFIVGVNLAQVQVEDDRFLDELKELSSDTGFPLTNLCLELTQGCRRVDIDILKKTVKELQGEGVRFVIDDFGTGVASIDFLRELSSDYIKFDSKYIDGITKRPEDREIVSHLTDLANACNTSVIIKGVENKAIYDAVSKMNIRSIQGYYYSRPMPIDDTLEYIWH